MPAVAAPSAASVNAPTVNLTWTDTATTEIGFTIQRATDPNFTTGVRWANVTNPVATQPSTVSWVDRNVARNALYWYRVWAIGPEVGDIATPGFPTMSADSVSDPLFVQVGTPTTVPAPTNLSALWELGLSPRLTWTDNAINETGFVVERCSGLDCGNTATNFAALPGGAPAFTGGNGTGTVVYTDSTATTGFVYSYRVMAVNTTTGAQSIYSNTAPNVIDPALTSVPAAPTSVTVGPVGGPVVMNWTHAGGANLIDFTIQYASNATFTRGVGSVTAPAGSGAQSAAVPVTTLYYRIRANGPGGSSARTNASPFPLR
ncbi:MAG: hypothetical protein EHM13_11925 [Acidobacteria bacterium]|nr:MAG: hypothetical protein EHM13_11925 [Acidobacteriota bacterium]